MRVKSHLFPSELLFSKLIERNQYQQGKLRDKIKPLLSDEYFAPSHKLAAHLQNKYISGCEFDTEALSDLWEDLLLACRYSKSVSLVAFSQENKACEALHKLSISAKAAERQIINTNIIHAAWRRLLTFLSIQSRSQTHGGRRAASITNALAVQSFSQACMHLAGERSIGNFHTHTHTINIICYSRNTCLGSVDRVRKIPSRCHKQIAAFRNFPARLQQTEKTIHYYIHSQIYGIVIKAHAAVSLTSSSLSKVSLVISIYLAANLLFPRANNPIRTYYVRNALRCVERNPFAWDAPDLHKIGVSWGRRRLIDIMRSWVVKPMPQDVIELIK